MLLFGVRGSRLHRMRLCHRTTASSPTRRSTTARSPGSCSTAPKRGTRRTAGMLVELDDAFLRGRGRRRRAGGDPRRRTGRCSRPATTWARRSRSRSTRPGPTSTRRFRINGGTRKGAEKLMLQEWHYFFENTRRWRNLRKITIAQVHGDGLRGRPHADVGVRPDRRRRRHALRRRRRHPARHVRRRVLRPPVGVRAAQDQGADAHRRSHRRVDEALPARHGVARSSRPTSSATARSSSPAASRSCPR